MSSITTSATIGAVTKITPLSMGGRRIRRGEHRNFHWNTEEIKTDLDFTLN